MHAKPSGLGGRGIREGEGAAVLLNMDCFQERERERGENILGVLR